MKKYRNLILGMIAVSGLLFAALYIKTDGVYAQNKNASFSPRGGKADTPGPFDKYASYNPKDLLEESAPEALTFIGPKPDAKSMRRIEQQLANRSPEALLGTAVESEPNNTPATANAIANNVKVRSANVYPVADVDYYSFQATAGDRVYAGTMTFFGPATSSTDSQLRLIASDGVTVIEFDDDNGSHAGLSSSIAGATIPSTGTYYLQVNDFDAVNGLIFGYDLYLQVQSAAPVPETEANDTPATANVLPASGLVSGTRNPAVATEQDWYSIPLNAGDTLVLSLDLDPERDTVTWNGRLGVALFGDASNQILVVDDAGTGDTAPQIPSEHLVMTARTAGTYFAFVDSASAATGGPTATYRLSAQVFPRGAGGINCTTYTSTNVPQAIGPGATLTSSTLTVPGNPRIQTIRPFVALNHTFFNQLDVHLRSPAGNDNGLFTDIGAAAVGGQAQMETYFDDDAGVTPVYTALRGLGLKPENAYRLNWFYGENAGGTWTLDIRDDVADANGGTLTAWGLEICEQTPPSGTLIYSEDFEAGDGGYTHSGTQDEWERGLPATVATNTTNPVAAFNNCNSGTNCWKTDLDNTYNASSTQSLVSPPLNLTQYPGPLTLSWAMRYQIELTRFDNIQVSMRQVGNPASERVLWRHYGPTMIDSVGNPIVNIPAAAGWGDHHVDISSFSGQIVEVIFRLDGDSSVVFGGLAIDDVQIRHVGPTAANVPVGGRVLTAQGMPIARANVSLTDNMGNSQTAMSNHFGYYSFENVAAGRTYTLTVNSKRYRVNPVFITVGDEITGLDLVALPEE